MNIEGRDKMLGLPFFALANFVCSRSNSVFFWQQCLTNAFMTFCPRTLIVYSVWFVTFFRQFSFWCWTRRRNGATGNKIWWQRQINEIFQNVTFRYVQYNTPKSRGSRKLLDLSLSSNNCSFSLSFVLVFLTLRLKANEGHEKMFQKLFNPLWIGKNEKTCAPVLTSHICICL